MTIEFINSTPYANADEINNVGAALAYREQRRTGKRGIVLVIETEDTRQYHFIPVGEIDRVARPQKVSIWRDCADRANGINEYALVYSDTRRGTTQTDLVRLNGTLAQCWRVCRAKGLI